MNPKKLFAGSRLRLQTIIVIIIQIIRPQVSNRRSYNWRISLALERRCRSVGFNISSNCEICVSSFLCPIMSFFAALNKSLSGAKTELFSICKSKHCKLEVRYSSNNFFFSKKFLLGNFFSDLKNFFADFGFKA